MLSGADVTGIIFQKCTFEYTNFDKTRGLSPAFFNECLIGDNCIGLSREIIAKSIKLK